MDTGRVLKTLLAIAWLTPLAGFAIEIFGGYWSTRRSKAAAYLAVGCIFLGFCTSVAAFCVWGNSTGWVALSHVEEPKEHAPSAGIAQIANEEHVASAAAPTHGPAPGERQTRFSGRFYTLATFGSLLDGSRGFSGWTVAGTNLGRNFTYEFTTDSNDLYLDVLTVPEPSTIALLGVAAVGLLGLARRRKRM